MARKYSDRRDGRHPGQGWYLEDEAHDWLLTKNRMAERRVRFWPAEVDLVARRLDDKSPSRLLGECKDWYRDDITPCVLWRLIALAMTARAEPLLVHNHRVGLTEDAQRIAEHWRVRVATDREVMRGAPLPDPERPRHGVNVGYPVILRDTVDLPHHRAPDYYGKLETEAAEEVLDRERW